LTHEHGDASGAGVRRDVGAGGQGRRARRDAVVRLLAGSALWLSVLLVTFWWEVDGGARDLTGWATGLDSVGRISALVASVLLLAQVVLMARVPSWSRRTGRTDWSASTAWSASRRST
jgi:hypothetical protein